jgi:Glyoxalase/Bleomycin resistance protein/Dioxygenase superfamily
VDDLAGSLGHPAYFDEKQDGWSALGRCGLLVDQLAEPVEYPLQSEPVGPFGVVRPTLGCAGRGTDAYGSGIGALVEDLRQQGSVGLPPIGVVHSTVVAGRPGVRRGPGGCMDELEEEGQSGVDDLDDQYDRLKRDGVEIITPIETEPWGERFFQVADPSGVVFQLVQWTTDSGSD